MSTVALTQALFDLPAADRIALADRLYASVPEAWQRSVDQAWLEEAERRSTEMDEDPSASLSHEEFLSGIQIHRTGA